MREEWSEGGKEESVCIDLQEWLVEQQHWAEERIMLTDTIERLKAAQTEEVGAIEGMQQQQMALCSEIKDALLCVNEQQQRISGLLSGFSGVKASVVSTCEGLKELQESEVCGRMERTQIITFLQRLTEEHASMMKICHSFK